MKRSDGVSFKEAWQLHWWAARTWWRTDPMLFLTTILHALAQALTPFVTIWLSARLIGELAGSRRPAVLWRWVLLTIAATAVLNLLTAGLYHWKEAVHGTEWQQESRLKFKKLMDMDFAALEAPRTNELRFSLRRHQMGNVYGFIGIHTFYLETLTGGLASIAGAAALTVSLFVQKVPASAGRLTLLNHPLSTAALVLIILTGAFLSPLLGARSTLTSWKLWPYFNRYNRALNIFSMLGTQRNRALDVRMYNQQAFAKNALRRTQVFQKGSPSRKIVLGEAAVYTAGSKAVSILLTGVVYGFVCLKAWAGAFGVGAVTQYVGAVTKLCAGISDLFSAIGNMPGNAALLRDMKEYLEIPNHMYQGSLTTEKRSDRQYEVEFRDVSFRYPGSETYALRHVNMKFKVGSRLAVVGMNGSGKTTFIKLLCRLYDPTEGQILLNGIDVRKYRYDDYINVFSVVFQDFQLLSLPLGENVAGAARYDQARVLDCLRKAGFEGRLAAMPKGLDTCLYKDLDKEGVDVSGGEAQKIAIARALYKDAPFIILDEPTAALDPIAEAEIYSKFNDIAGDKTAIYISHRLSSCKFCDEIAVFHEGRVIQQGSHEELLAEKDGKYYALWNAQAQYYTN